MNLLGKEKMMKSINKNENGIALVVVLSALIFIGVITASIVVMSKVSAYSAKTFVDRDESSYFAESVMARAQWLLMYDKSMHTNRNLGQVSLDETIEHYLADGVKHSITMNEIESEFAIYDMSAGYDISGKTPTKNLESMLKIYNDEPDKREEFQTFLNRVKDYVDTNDLLRNNGFERTDYANSELVPLPRNDIMQYREEMLFIPNFTDYFKIDDLGRLSGFTIIPPNGLRYSNKQINFFSASKDTLSSKTSYDETQLNLIIEARDRWKNEKIPLSESLDPDVVGALKSKFSFKESGYYTLIIDTSVNTESAKRKLIVSFKGYKSIPKGGIQYYEWILY